MPGAVRFLTSGTSFARSVTTKSRIRSQRGEGSDGLLPFLECRPEGGEVFGAETGSIREADKRLVGVGAVLEAPRRLEVVGVVGLLALVEGDDLVDAVLVAVGVRHGGVRR